MVSTLGRGVDVPVKDGSGESQLFSPRNSALQGSKAKYGIY